MRKIVATITLLTIISLLSMITGCSSSYEYESGYGSKPSTGEVIREQLGDGPADAYYEGERRWNEMTGQ